MLDSQSAEPMQTLIDASKFDMSNFEPALLNYYSIDKKLLGMPFNSSTPLLYYNKKLFSEAGLDPNAPPKTWEEALTFGEKLTKKDAAGKVSQYGMAIPIDGWYFEQWMNAQNALLVDNENGRANRATKTFLNGENGVKILEWWKSTIDKGVGTNLGRGGSETQKAFAASQIAMTFDSTASMRGIVNGIGDKFEVGTGYLLRPAATIDQGGVTIGGASVYMMKDKAAREKEATWKFVQWLVQPEQQAAWHVATGLLPRPQGVVQPRGGSGEQQEVPAVHHGDRATARQQADPGDGGGGDGAVHPGPRAGRHGDRGGSARQGDPEGGARQGHRRHQPGARTLQRLGAVTASDSATIRQGGTRVGAALSRYTRVETLARQSRSSAMTSTPRFTIDDLETLPDTLDDTRYELIDGELHIAHQPHWAHQFAGAMLGMELQAWSRWTGRGSANIAPGVIFSQHDAVAPDVLWISRERRAQGLRPDGKLYIAPEIAIEILSPGAPTSAATAISSASSTRAKGWRNTGSSIGARGRSQSIAALATHWSQT
jgi:hypothetical protein